MKKNLLICSTIVLSFVIFSLFFYQKYLEAEIFYDIDPYYHYVLSNQTFFTGDIPTYQANCFVKNNIEYPTTLWAATSIYSMTLGTDLLFVHKIFGMFCVLAFSFLLFISIRRTMDIKTALFSLFLFFSVTFLITRGLDTLPENMAFVALTGIIFSTITQNFRLGTLFTVFLVMTHFPSAFIMWPLFIPLFYFAPKLRTHKLFFIILVLILLIPIYPTIIKKVSDYYVLHTDFFDKRAQIKEYDLNQQRYALLNEDDYTSGLGTLLVLFSFLGIFRIYENKHKNYFYFLFGLGVLLFLLSTGFFGIFYFPYYRILTFLFLPLFFIAASSLKIYLQKFDKKTKLLFSFLFVLISLVSLFNVSGRIAVNKDFFESAQELNNLEGTKIAYSSFIQNVGVNGSECRSEKKYEIFNSPTSKDFVDNLQDLPKPIYFCAVQSNQFKYLEVYSFLETNSEVQYYGSIKCLKFKDEVKT